jgi:hypothetical protein
MVYVVQSYWACVGLYPSSCMWKTKDHNVSETGSVSVLRWMGQDKPTQVGPLESASLNHWAQLSRFILPHPPEDGDRSSLRNVVVFCLLYTRRWIESKISSIVLYSFRHVQYLTKYKAKCFVSMSSVSLHQWIHICSWLKDLWSQLGLRNNTESISQNCVLQTLLLSWSS